MNKLKLLYIIEILENIVGIYRKFSQFQNFKTKIITLVYIILLYSFIILGNLKTIEQVDSNFDFKLNEPSWYFHIFQYFETFVIHVLAIWYSKEYENIKCKINNYISISNDSRNGRHFNLLLLFFFITLVFLIIIECINTSRVEGSAYLGFLFTFTYYINATAHFLQILMCSTLCRNISDIILLLESQINIYTKRNSWNIYKHHNIHGNYINNNVHGLWIIYNDLIGCCENLTKINGIQVTFLLLNILIC